MGETIVHNGKEFTKDEVVELFADFANKVRKVWNVIKTVLIKAAKYLVSLAGYMRKQPGYKRMCKWDGLEKYEAISEGKSNNWRKTHGLHLIRHRA